MQTGARFESLIAVLDRLRDPGGCPWDSEQTMESLQPYLIEEAYECLDAMERGDRAEQCDELGDLLSGLFAHQVHKQFTTGRH